MHCGKSFCVYWYVPSILIRVKYIVALVTHICDVVNFLCLLICSFNLISDKKIVLHWSQISFPISGLPREASEEEQLLAGILHFNGYSATRMGLVTVASVSDAPSLVHGLQWQWQSVKQWVTAIELYIARGRFSAWKSGAGTACPTETWGRACMASSGWRRAWKHSKGTCVPKRWPTYLFHYRWM